MALVNPNIAMSFRGVEVPQQNALADYAAVQQIQSGQRQGQLADMQIEKIKRDEAALGTMMNTITAKGGPSDPMEAAQAMIKSGIPHFMDTGFKIQQTHQQLLQDRAAMGLPPAGGAATAAPAAAAPVSEAYPGYNESIGMPAPTNALAPASEAYPGYNESIGMTNALAPTAAAPVNAMAPSAGKDAQIMQAKQMLLSANPGVRIAGEQQLKMLTSEAPDAALMKQLGYPLTQAGYQAFRDAQRQERMLTPLEEAQKIRIANASRPPAQPRPEQPPVAVVDPVTGKQVYVTREEALRNKMTPASAMEGLAPKEIQAREAKYPAATSAVKTFETGADKLAADLDKLATHPGLSGISGLIYGRTPAVTKDARAAQALYDSIVARGGFQELQNMRASSPTGGALGNVSNQEGQYLRDAFAPINRTQDTTDLSQSLKDAAAATRTSKQRVRDAYDMTYDYKNQGKASAPAAGAPPDIDALLNKYK
jgi:hypothetical protein